MARKTPHVVNQAKTAAQLNADLAELKKLTSAIDSWSNVLTGLGVSGKDKRLGGTVTYTGPLQQVAAEQLYSADKTARRITDILPDDGTREWIDFKGKDAPALADAMDAIKTKPKFKSAWSWARMYGGAALLINDGTDPSELEDPFDKPGHIHSLTLFHRHELAPMSSDIQSDITKPDYGEPEFYRLTAANARIHVSRLLIFDGLPLPAGERISNQYWGDSVLTPLCETLRDYKVGYGAVATLIQDFKMLIYKVKGLAAKIAAGEESTIQKRVALMNLYRSTMSVIIADKDNEEFKVESSPLQGIKDLLIALKEKLLSESDMPHTKLFNESPSGQGATGNSESRNWADYVRAWQTTYIAPIQDKLNDAIFRSIDGPTRGAGTPEDFDYDFKSIFQLDEVEQATVDKTNAETDKIYAVDIGATDANEVREQRFPDLDDKDVVLPELIAEPAAAAAAPAPAADPTGEGLDPDKTAGGGAKTEADSAARADKTWTRGYQLIEVMAQDAAFGLGGEWKAAKAEGRLRGDTALDDAYEPRQTAIQSLVFSKKIFPTMESVTAWIKEHRAQGFHTRSVDVKPNTFIIRQFNAKGITRSTIKKLRPGLTAVICFK